MNKRVLMPYRHEKKLVKYVQAVRMAGLEPIPVPVCGTPEISGAGGLLLMGGTDVNPRLYRAAAEPETQPPDDERDAFELEILRRVLDSDLPVFAICRGLQLLNVYAGGTLRQHLGSLRHNPAEDVLVAHNVEIAPGTLLSSIAGKTNWPVNSYHHQAVTKVGAGLRISARDSEDGTIEALELSGRTFVLGVQWHPEDMVSESPEQLKLFQHFADHIEAR